MATNFFRLRRAFPSAPRPLFFPLAQANVALARLREGQSDRRRRAGARQCRRKHMDYRRIGRSGLKVSEICLGTMTFGHGADEAEAGRIVGTCLDAGVNFFDTANTYNAGVSETMLGNILRGKRRQAVDREQGVQPDRARGRTIPAIRARTSCRPSRTACAGCNGLSRHLLRAPRRRAERRWRKCCARSTISCTRARCATSRAAITRRGG